MATTYAIPNGRTVMDATTYTGTGAGQSIVNSDLGTTGFKPDFVWMKVRNTTGSHILQNSVIGATKGVISDSTSSEFTDSSTLTAFTSNGFTAGGNTQTNSNANTYVAWQWQAGGTAVSNTSGSITSSVSANPTSGFSVVSYTGTGANATVGHGLSLAPQFMLVKCRSQAYGWPVYHASIGNAAYLVLNTSAGQVTGYPTMWNSTSPTSSVLSVGTDNGTNQSGQTYLAYCWAPVAGFSQFGSYTGNGSTDGPFVYTGFRPKFIMIKRTDSAGYQWSIWDTSRNTYNVAGSNLWADSSEVETTSDAGYGTDLLSNGFKVRNTNAARNASGGTYIYAAFAENPFKYSNAR